MDVSLINTIPLPLEEIPDQFVWQFSDSGACTVHSRYEIVQNGLIRIPIVGATSPMDAGVWNNLWSFPIPPPPPKLQFFMWACILGILPTRAALSTRIKDIDRLYQVCTISIETVSHLLLSCPLAVRFGDMMDISLGDIFSPNFCIVWRRVLHLPPPVGRGSSSFGGECGNLVIRWFFNLN
ncbi:hypothetical protein LINPERHAP2_LOCUS40243 [Linum perenne]